MGMIMSFAAITTEELASVLTDADAVTELIATGPRAGYARVDLDKSWDGIRYLMRTAGLGVDLLEDGRTIGDEGTMSGWSAADVERAAVAMRDVPFSDLLDRYDPQRMEDADVYPNIWATEWALDYLLDNYRRLRHFFIDTAAEGQAALMVWG